MIAFQLALLYVCLKYKNVDVGAVDNASKSVVNTGTHLLGALPVCMMTTSLMLVYVIRQVFIGPKAAI